MKNNFLKTAFLITFSISCKKRLGQTNDSLQNLETHASDSNDKYSELLKGQQKLDEELKAIQEENQTTFSELERKNQNLAEKNAELLRKLEIIQIKHDRMDDVFVTQKDLREAHHLIIQDYLKILEINNQNLQKLISSEIEDLHAHVSETRLSLEDQQNQQNQLLATKLDEYDTIQKETLKRLEGLEEQALQTEVQLDQIAEEQIKLANQNETLEQKIEDLEHLVLALETETKQLNELTRSLETEIFGLKSQILTDDINLSHLSALVDAHLHEWSEFIKSLIQNQAKKTLLTKQIQETSEPTQKAFFQSELNKINKDEKKLLDSNKTILEEFLKAWLKKDTLSISSAPPTNTFFIIESSFSSQAANIIAYNVQSHHQCQSLAQKTSEEHDKLKTQIDLLEQEIRELKEESVEQDEKIQDLHERVLILEKSLSEKTLENIDKEMNDITTNQLPMIEATLSDSAEKMTINLDVFTKQIENKLHQFKVKIDLSDFSL
jgi:hypothetical protein